MTVSYFPLNRLRICHIPYISPPDDGQSGDTCTRLKPGKVTIESPCGESGSRHIFSVYSRQTVGSFAASEADTPSNGPSVLKLFDEV